MRYAAQDSDLKEAMVCDVLRRCEGLLLQNIESHSHSHSLLIVNHSPFTPHLTVSHIQYRQDDELGKTEVCHIFCCKERTRLTGDFSIIGWPMWPAPPSRYMVHLHFNPSQSRRTILLTLSSRPMGSSGRR